MKHILNLLMIIIAVFFAGLILEGFIEELPASIAPMKESFKLLSDLFPVFVFFSIFSVIWFAYSKSRDKHSLFIGIVFLVIGLAAILYSEALLIYPMSFPSSRYVYYISPSGSDSNLETSSSNSSRYVYYISPSGSDSNLGTSSSNPWYTFTYAIPKLVAGDTLILMDGTYESSTTGLPVLDCTINAGNGLSDKPITMRAQNERKAFLKSSSTANSFVMNNCAYWVIDGLRFEGGDFSGSSGSAFQVGTSNHITLRRLLGAKSNRYGNNHLMLLSYTNNILVEESEFYEFHRHAIINWYSSNNIIRRNYVNSRNYTHFPESPTGIYNYGDEGISFYPSHDDIVENNIVEHAAQGFTVHGTGPGTSDNNSYLGNIGIDTIYGAFKADGRDGNVIKNTQYVDSVSVNTVEGFDLGAGLNGGAITSFTVSNATILNLAPSPNGLSYGMSIGNTIPTSQRDITVTNALLSTSSGTAGFSASGLYDWLFDYTNVYSGVSSDWSPNDYHVTNSKQIDPKLGNCIAWVPSDSPMKGAGKNGTDIGANVLYRYENGVLTNKPLWNPVTGEFPHGAVIAGVNDISGQSAFDVHKRLNINTNGCLFPSGYGNYSVLRKVLDIINHLPLVKLANFKNLTELEELLKKHKRILINLFFYRSAYLGFIKGRPRVEGFSKSLEE